MPQSNNAKNDEYTQLDRRKQVAALYLRGDTQWEIARRLGCAQGTVSKDLAAIRKEWLASALRDFDAMKAEEFAKLDHLEAVAWEAWEESCKDAETRREKTEAARQNVKGERRERHRPVPVRRISERTTRTQAGDPRFLEQVFHCIEARMRILGLFKSPQLNVSQTVINWDALYERPGPDAPDPIEEKIRLAALPAPDVRTSG